jgi:hypothetical protein
MLLKPLSMEALESATICSCHVWYQTQTGLLTQQGTCVPQSILYMYA